MAESSDSLVSDNINIQKQQNVTVVQTESQEVFNKTEEVLEPVLVEDMNDDCVPKTYENLRNIFEQKNIYLDRNDIIAILLYICMLEMGFVTKHFENLCEEDDGVDFNYKRILTLSKHFPIDWKKNNIYEFSFTLLPFPLYTCNLTVIKTSDDILINSNVRNIENCTACMLIDPALYVVSSSTNVRKARFQNVKSLATNFKTKICYKMKLSILLENNVRLPHILTLPEDILMQVASNFNSLSTLSRFQQVCQLFKEVTEEEKLWKRLINIECKVDNNSSSKIYKKLKKGNKKLAHLKNIAANKKKILE